MKKHAVDKLEVEVSSQLKVGCCLAAYERLGKENSIPEMLPEYFHCAVELLNRAINLEKLLSFVSDSFDLLPVVGQVLF